jgi:hypothetical protein
VMSKNGTLSAVVMKGRALLQPERTSPTRD